MDQFDFSRLSYPASKFQNKIKKHHNEWSDDHKTVEDNLFLDDLCPVQLLQ